MERERGSKVLAIVALCVGVVGLSLGFAAFSSNLVIKSSATVEANSGEFSVVWDGTSIESSVVGTAVAGNPSVTTTQITQGNDTVDASTIGNLSAALKAPGDSVTYTFNAKNAGKYIAYLTDVNFLAGKECTAVTGTDQDLVDAACENISLTLKVGTETITSTTSSYTNEIAIGGTTPVEVTIAYAAVDGQTLADGDFNVSFGDIQFVYSSAR
ncbi:MAG: hypothetical protein E7174_03645 [Firmicutes bacterium]|nr:hypothetical protein [Bacillota bacterium]